MRRRFRRATVWFASAAIPFALFGACNDGSQSPQSSSVTHFLDYCTTTCGEGFECVCGACTRPCSDSALCMKLFPGATCVEADAACSASGAAKVCAVLCVSDDDCTDLVSAHRCMDGHCRASLLDAG